MTSIQPELWADRGAHAVAFFQAAFGATVLHHVGDGEGTPPPSWPPATPHSGSSRQDQPASACTRR
jgi:uncharacterized glyoxalase superfamily protein PhnB